MTDPREKLARARELARDGWEALLQRDDVAFGRARLQEARHIVAEALREPAPAPVRFELVGVLAEVSSQLGDTATVVRCATMLPLLCPQGDPGAAESLVRRMIDRWGALDEASRAIEALRMTLGPQRAAGLEARIARRRQLILSAPMSTSLLLALKTALARTDVVQTVGGELRRRQPEDLRLTRTWLTRAGLSIDACVSFLESLGARTDADVLLVAEPLEPYDVPAAWAAVAIARRARAADRARAGVPSRAAITGMASGPIRGGDSVPVSAPVHVTPAPTPYQGTVSDPVPAVLPPPSPQAAPPPPPPPPAPTPVRSDGDRLVLPYEDPYGRFQGRFEDDGRSGYLYLFDRTGRRRLMNPVWVYNRVTASAAIPAQLAEGEAPPPMAAAHMLSPEPLAGAEAHELELHVAEDGAWVAVQIRGRLMALVDYHQRVGWSRLLSTDTPFGLAWTDGLPDAI